MSDWDKFKTAGSGNEKQDSKASLISAVIFTSILCGALGGGIGFLVVAYIANSDEHQMAIIMAESHSVLSYETIQGIITGGALIGLALGFVLGIKIFAPHIFASNDENYQSPDLDDPFDEDMRG